MSTTQTEATLDTRPTVKQDVIFARTGSGVIFHNASTGFQLAGASAYDFARKVIPHLDGRTRVLEIRDALPQQHQQTFLTLVDSLTRYGFVRTEEPGDNEVCLSAAEEAHFEAQINYIAHYQGGARRRFHQVRTARVVVLGSDETARWVVLGLLRNGFANIGAEAELLDPDTSGGAIRDELSELASGGVPASVTSVDASSLNWSAIGACQAVVVCGDGSATRSSVLLKAGIPAGVSLLSATRVGERVIVGPLMSMSVPGCLTCALLRLGANDSPERLADCVELWRGISGATLPGIERRGSRPVAAMLGNLLAYEIFRQVSDLMPPESKGAVIVQHLGSADVSTEPLVAHPRCARCAQLLPPTEGELYGVIPEIEPRVEAASDGSEEPNEQNRPNRFQAIFGPNVGLLAQFDDAADEQLPVRVGRVIVGIAPGDRRRVTGFDVHTTFAARTRAVCAATAAYALAMGMAPTADPEDPAIPIVGAGRFDVSVLERPVPPRDWVRAVTFLGRSDIAIPAAAAFSTGPRNQDGLFHRSGAGVAAAPSLAQAVGSAVVSALALGALMHRISDQGTRLVDQVSVMADDQLAYLRSSAVNLGADLDLLDLGADIGVSVVLARAVGATGEPWWSLGSGLNWRQAATDALCQTIGQLQTGQGNDSGVPTLAAFHPWSLVPADTIAAPLAKATTFDQLRGDLRVAGRDLALVDIGGADLAQGGIRVVRALGFHGGDHR